MPKEKDSGVMASRPSLVTPSGRFEMHRSSKFPSVKIPRLSNQYDSRDTSRWQQRQKIAVVVDLHIDTNNSAPNEYKGVVNSSGLVVYKGLTEEIKVQRKVKTGNKLRV